MICSATGPAQISSSGPGTSVDVDGAVMGESAVVGDGAVVVVVASGRSVEATVGLSDVGAVVVDEPPEQAATSNTNALATIEIRVAVIRSLSLCPR